MAEGTRDYKRLETMIKDLKDNEQKRDKELSRVEGKVDAAMEEIKTMMSGMTIQYNDIRSQLSQLEGGLGEGSILGNPTRVVGEVMNPTVNGHTFRYGTKLKVPRFAGNDVEEWLFKIEQFFVLDRMTEQFKVSLMALYLEGSALHWHKSLIKLKGRVPGWNEYVMAMKSRFGSLAYEDPMAKLKKLKQTGSLKEYLRAFELLLDKAQLSQGKAISCFLAGLRHEMEMMVRMFNPKTLQEAYSLAKLQEAVRQDLGGASQGGGRSLYSKTMANIGAF